MSARHSHPSPPRLGHRIQNRDKITAASKAGKYQGASTAAGPASASGFWTQILNP